MEMRNAVAEDVDIDDLRAACRFQRARACRQDRTEGLRLVAVQIGDEGDVALRLEVGKARHFRRQADGEPPMRIVPDLDAFKLCIRGAAAAHRTVAPRHGPSPVIGFLAMSPTSLAKAWDRGPLESPRSPSL